MKFSIFFFLFLSIIAQAQTKRFYYELKYKNDSTFTEYEKTNFVLDVNPDEVKFYEEYFIEVDSINKTKPQAQNHFWGEFNIVTRKINSSIHQNYQMIDNVFIYESKDDIKWKLSQETKKIGNYTVQKATTTFGGRNWIAWFSSEINITEGPYKFRGLPGLIFQIYDDKENFHFSFVKNNNLKETYNTRDFIDYWAGTKPVKATFKQVKSKLLEYYQDPLKDFRIQFDENPGTKYFVNSVQITSKDQFKELSEKEQERIRKYNNPIELDKAIHYPTK